MITSYDIPTRLVGFGLSKEAAERDLQFNIARQHIEKSEYFMKRRQTLYTWLPMENFLVIKGKTSLKYEDGYIIDLKNSAKCKVVPKKLGHYLQLYTILARYISYQDFTVTIGKEVDTFLNNISPIYGSLKDFPLIEPADVSDVDVVHILRTKDTICESYSDNKIKLVGGDKIIGTYVPEGVDKQCIVSYLLANISVAYNTGVSYKGVL